MINVTHIVGIDEVGRGPLAGPIAFCACVVAHGFDYGHLEGIKDSKKLSPQKRAEWFHKLSAMKAVGTMNFSYVEVPADKIDSMGLPWAIERAIHECLDTLHAAEALDPQITQVFLDGSLRAPKKFVLQETIIKGDEKVPVIAAASIFAKVMRDRYMEEQAKVYPQYGFDAHKGYGTAAHLLAIRKHGLTPIHRRSFLSKVTGTAVVVRG
ncbi:MAG: ribonuclease HII [bacterium]|nr:ribonuclease HII [bacterium]